jgi:hypothetical protein
MWNSLKLEGRHSMRMVCATIRLYGRLNLHCLQEGLSEIVRRHESLRTRIVSVRGNPTQHVDSTGSFELQFVELAELPEEERNLEERRQVEQLIYEPFFISQGPLFAARLLRLERDTHLLILAMDHMISDGASVGILLRDLSALYSEFAGSPYCRLPAIPIQLADYAVWQQRTHGSWIEKHGFYWKQRLAGARRAQMFATSGATTPAHTGWLMLQTRFAEHLCLGLRQAGHQNQTTVAMCTLAAYVASLFRWYERNDLVIPFLTTGRVYPEITSTVGPFGHPLYLRLELLESDNFLDLLTRVTEEYATAYQHDDSCAISALLPTPEFSGNPAFSWNTPEFGMLQPDFNQLASAEQRIIAEQLECPITVRDDMDWDCEPRLDLSETKRGITGTIKCRTDRFTLSTLQRFERNLCVFIQTLIKEPRARIKTVRCAR